MLQRALRKRVEKPAQAVAQPPHHRIRERNSPLEPRCPDELDRLVHRRVWRDFEVSELVCAEPERRAHGWVELSHGPLAERLDPVVERADPLHGAVGDLLRQGAVTPVEPCGRALEHAVRVGVVLEDTADDLVGRPASGRYRRPLSHSA